MSAELEVYRRLLIKGIEIPIQMIRVDPVVTLESGKIWTLTVTVEDDTRQLIRPGTIGTPVEFYGGYIQPYKSGVPSYKRVFQGVITQSVPDFQDNGRIYAVIVASGQSHIMGRRIRNLDYAAIAQRAFTGREEPSAIKVDDYIRTTRDRKWANVGPDGKLKLREIVTNIVAEYSVPEFIVTPHTPAGFVVNTRPLRVVVELSDSLERIEFNPKKKLSQLDMTDFEFIVHLAESYGCSFYADPDDQILLHFRADESFYQTKESFGGFAATSDITASVGLSSEFTIPKEVLRKQEWGIRIYRAQLGGDYAPREGFDPRSPDVRMPMLGSPKLQIDPNTMITGQPMIVNAPDGSVYVKMKSATDSHQLVFYKLNNKLIEDEARQGNSSLNEYRSTILSKLGTDAAWSATSRYWIQVDPELDDNVLPHTRYARRGWSLSCTTPGSLYYVIGRQYPILGMDYYSGQWILNKITHSFGGTFKSSLTFVL